MVMVVKAAITKVEAAAEVAGESKEAGDAKAAGEPSWMARAMREPTTPVVIRRLCLQTQEGRTCGKRRQAAAAVIAAG